ncbi:hypothetical protein EV368DRAFT_38925 [Lentinula lateritia]|uniref:Uncharacterized protein n=1 Tax=Lentinula aff. lateritia TaxID=2804960 RepID=A0ACC1UDK9_9AGAR|nr:hypothetical protein F5876DRAFT_31492 [Lentinula aff. lateritia]KAJ3853424.1 hypothetical protein EV368DRAFT_38925 [Lentinula lateritia]
MAEVESSPATIEINDALFCQHYKEVCAICEYDGREENDAFFGFDPIDREGIEAPSATINKDGDYQCKKHALTGKSSLNILDDQGMTSERNYHIPACNQCYGWKKQITRLRTQAKKAGKK